MANEEAEFKELPKAEKPKFSIYNNRFYRHLYLSEEIAEKRMLENRGCDVVDKIKNDSCIASNTKFNFWVLIGVGLLIIYGLIRHWMG